MSGAMPKETMEAVHIRQRVRRVHDQLAGDRERELGRAVEFKAAGNQKMAGYHAGLADGRNAALVELRKIMHEYPSGDAAAAGDDL